MENADQSQSQVKTPASLIAEAVSYFKAQRPETVLLFCVLAAVVYGIYLGASALFHEIPRQISSVTESHERAVDKINASHERRSAEDHAVINKLLERHGIAGARETRNLAVSPK